MRYEIKQANQHVYFIKWYVSPDDEMSTGRQFIKDLQLVLNSRQVPAFFISDLREARIRDVSILRRLAELSRHPNWGGGTAFASDLTSSVYQGFFQKIAEAEGDLTDTLEGSIASIEAMQPGVTADIDWESILGGEC